MPFDPKSNVAEKLANLPRIEQGVKMPRMGPPNAIDRHEFYSAVQIDESFVAPDRAFADHCVRWGRYNGRKFAKRLVVGTTTYRVWRTA